MEQTISGFAVHGTNHQWFCCSWKKPSVVLLFMEQTISAFVVYEKDKNINRFAVIKLTIIGFAVNVNSKQCADWTIN